MKLNKIYYDLRDGKYDREVKRNQYGKIYVVSKSKYGTSMAHILCKHMRSDNEVHEISSVLTQWKVHKCNCEDKNSKKEILRKQKLYLFEGIVIVGIFRDCPINNNVFCFF